jgi:gliding motility-associated protein GldM
MAGGNLSPRQKMINMMYLVLTALLAMNVSKEILDSFVTVNNGLEMTKGTLQGQMDKTYASFSKNASQNALKYGKAYADAKVIQDMANGLIKHIDSLKVKIIHESEKLPIDKIIAKDATGKDTVINMMYLHNKDAYNEITNMMVGSEPAKPREDAWSATELKLKLIEYRDKLKAMNSTPAFTASMDALFNFNNRLDASFTDNNWESINFYHVPVAAGVTILSKIQSDIRNGENELINKLFADVEGESFKFNKLTAIIKPQSSSITVGGTYRADIFLGAYDDQNSPEVFIPGPGATVDSAAKKINGEAIKLPMEGTRAKLERAGTSAGQQVVTGLIKFRPVGGEEQIEFFRAEYDVAAPLLVVSPTKMNVFYRGVDNPVSISVGGYIDKNVQGSISSGHSLQKGKDGYIVKPGKDSKATVTATVTNADGTKKTMPGIEFRVKNVPNPTPYFAGKSANDETVKKSELTAAQGVIAKMENFEFDLKFEVVEYRVTMIVAGTPIEKVTKGAALSGDMKEMLTKAKPGQKVYIEGIKARGPDGTVRNLGGLSFKVT